MERDKLEVGMQIFVREDIFDDGNDYSPGGYLARRGDVVVVKKICGETSDFICSVKHPCVTDDTGFYVRRNEVMETDPILTIEEQKEWEKRHGVSLKERFVRRVYPPRKSF